MGVYLATAPGKIGLRDHSVVLDGDLDVWEVDAKGLALQPDFPALYEHGAYAEEDSLWFDEGLSDATDALHESYGEEISYEIALSDPGPFISLTGTALVPEAIPPARLRLLS